MFAPLDQSPDTTASTTVVPSVKSIASPNAAVVPPVAGVGASATGSVEKKLSRKRLGLTDSESDALANSKLLKTDEGTATALHNKALAVGDIVTVKPRMVGGRASILPHFCIIRSLPCAPVESQGTGSEQTGGYCSYHHDSRR